MEGEVCNVAYSQVVEFGLCFNWAKKFMQVRVFEDTEADLIKHTAGKVQGNLDGAR